MNASGSLPGARNLEQASRLLLVATGTALTTAAIDFVLQKIGYRFHHASLSNALSRSAHIKWRRADGHWEHPTGDAAELALRKALKVVPPRHREQWCTIRDRLHEQVNATLEARQKVLHNMSDLRRYGIDWDSNPA
jgi:hypothetical protein